MITAFVFPEYVLQIEDFELYKLMFALVVIINSFHVTELT